MNDAYFGRSAPKYTIRFRGEINKVTNIVPGANYYNVKLEETFSKKHTNPTLGYGKKYDFTKSEQMLVPGPQYSISSQFDRFDKRKQLEKLKQRELIKLKLEESKMCKTVY